MKKNKAARTATKEVTNETTTIENATVVIETGDTTPTVTVTEEDKKSLGRPVNPDSARQKRLATMKDKFKGGFPKLGRPAAPDSKRQQKLAEIKAKKASGETVKKGRPKMTEEEKVKARADRQAAYEVWLKNQGIEAPVEEAVAE